MLHDWVLNSRDLSERIPLSDCQQILINFWKVFDTQRPHLTIIFSAPPQQSSSPSPNLKSPAPSPDVPNRLHSELGAGTVGAEMSCSHLCVRMHIELFNGYRIFSTECRCVCMMLANWSLFSWSGGGGSSPMGAKWSAYVRTRGEGGQNNPEVERTYFLDVLVLTSLAQLSMRC